MKKIIAVVSVVFVLLFGIEVKAYNNMATNYNQIYKYSIVNSYSNTRISAVEGTSFVYELNQTTSTYSGWYFMKLSDGSYLIQNSKTQTVLSIPEGNEYTSNSYIQLELYSYADRQKWIVEGSGDRVTIRSFFNTNMYLVGGNFALKMSDSNQSFQEGTRYWKIFENTDTGLLGLDETDRNRLECLYSSENYLSQQGYYNYNELFSTSIVGDNAIRLLKNNVIFISRSHGFANPNGITGLCLYPTGDYELYKVYSKGPQGRSIIDPNTDTPYVDLSKNKLALFVGCSTGFGGENNEDNIVNCAISAGCETAIGFKYNIFTNQGNLWTENFMYNFVVLGKTVEEAATLASIDTLTAYKNSGSANFELYIAGNKNLTLRSFQIKN